MDNSNYSDYLRELKIGARRAGTPGSGRASAPGAAAHPRGAAQGGGGAPQAARTRAPGSSSLPRFHFNLYSYIKLHNKSTIKEEQRRIEEAKRRLEEEKRQLELDKQRALASLSTPGSPPPAQVSLGLLVCSYYSCDFYSLFCYPSLFTSYPFCLSPWQWVRQ